MFSSADYLAGGVNDLRFKSRLLRSLTRDLDDNGDGQSRLFAGEGLGNILEKVQIHGILSERRSEVSAVKNEAKLMEEWHLAVDAWVERLLLLISDKMPQKCWAGTCLLGVTIEECTSDHLIASYTVWFEKLLQNIQASSNNRSVNEASCACLSDLFTRLSGFSNVKKESTSFAGRLVQPVLQLVDGNGPVVEGAIDLLCTLMKFYPSAVYRSYDKVESALASSIMAVNSNREVLKKFAGALALLPHTKGDSESWSVMMQKLLICINSLLNDAFQGLEEEGKGSEIMKLLVPAGKEAPPPLGGQTKPSDGNLRATRRLGQSISPLLSSLTYSCGIMLTNTYPVQVAVPVRPLLKLIGRVLSVDGTLVSRTVLPSTTTLYQELLCSELPSFHLYILDLLVAAIKGLKSQLLPHAASVVHAVTDFFRRATLPSIRAKVYYTLEMLLHSMGVGMSLYLAEHVVSNASVDLNEDCASNCTSKLGNETLLKISPKKRKRGRASSQSNGAEKETNYVTAVKKSKPLSVKIAALRAMETLIAVGGSLKNESWRLEADRLLINAATNSFDVFTGKAVKNYCMEESAKSQEEYRLVALQALLASLLSPSHVRPPYLSEGLKLFQKGKLETGTEVATFCEKALLALEVLIHPRDIPLVNYPIPIAASVTVNELEDEERYRGWLDASDDEKLSPGDENEDKQPQSMEVDLRVESNGVEERVEDNREAATLSVEPENIESSSVSRPAVDELASQKLGNIVPDTKYAVSQDIVEENQKESSYYDLLGNNSLKGKALMNDSDSDSLGSIPPIVDADPDSDSNSDSFGSIPPIVDADPDTDSDSN